MNLRKRSIPFLVAYAAACAMVIAATSACPGAAPVVGPTSSCVTKVLEDALKGMTVPQIVADAGPGCVADAAQVITILLGAEDPRIAGTVAYKQAVLSRPKP